VEKRHPIQQESDIERLRVAASWLVGRECWRAECGYDLWLEFGPARPMWSPRIAAASRHPGAADETQGSLQFVTGWATWAVRHEGRVIVSSEDDESVIATDLAVFSARPQLVEAVGVTYPELAVQIRFASGSVLAVTPDFDEATAEDLHDGDCWSVRCVPYDGGPSERSVHLAAGLNVWFEHPTD
jgi:hypothetical protein